MIIKLTDSLMGDDLHILKNIWKLLLGLKVYKNKIYKSSKFKGLWFIIIKKNYYLLRVIIGSNSF